MCERARKRDRERMIERGGERERDSLREGEVREPFSFGDRVEVVPLT